MSASSDTAFGEFHPFTLTRTPPRGILFLLMEMDILTSSPQTFFQKKRGEYRFLKAEDTQFKCS